MPDDTGVRMNGGHAGAAEGPSSFRAALAGYGVGSPEGFVWPGVFDAGDVLPGATLDDTHEHVSKVAGDLTARGMLVVGIGGGHDLTWALVRGVLMHCSPLSGVYFDAHLDVRPESGSGMSFHRLLRHPDVRSIHAIGIDRLVNSTEHAAWFQGHGGRMHAADGEMSWPEGELFVSFDLDAIDASSAPGVSARNPCGMSSQRASAWASAAGQRPGVRCFDIMELCPRRDHDGRTARLAAHLFLSFLRGVASRSSGRTG